MTHNISDSNTEFVIRVKSGPSSKNAAYYNASSIINNTANNGAKNTKAIPIMEGTSIDIYYRQNKVNSGTVKSVFEIKFERVTAKQI